MYIYTLSDWYVSLKTNFFIANSAFYFFPCLHRVFGSVTFTHQPSAEQLTKQSLGLKGLNRLNHLAQCPFIELMRQRAAQTDNTHTWTHTHTHANTRGHTLGWRHTGRLSRHSTMIIIFMRLLKDTFEGVTYVPGEGEGQQQHTGRVNGGSWRHLVLPRWPLDSTRLSQAWIRLRLPNFSQLGHNLCLNLPHSGSNRNGHCNNKKKWNFLQ